MNNMSIWQTQQIILNRLLLWSRFSVIGGLGLLRGNAFWRGVGWQAIGWGLVDAAIAIWGGRAMRRRYAALPNPEVPAVQAQESRNLRHLLWLNAGLDVLYIVGGLILQRRRNWRGHGWGIIIQGSFLFLFDLYHAVILAEEREV
ncbi:MAG: hypothetical protein Fur0044_06110 [Anaerolineae bacterium]